MSSVILSGGTRKGSGGRFHNPRPPQSQGFPDPARRPPPCGFNRPRVSPGTLRRILRGADAALPVHCHLLAELHDGRIEVANDQAIADFPRGK